MTDKTTLHRFGKTLKNLLSRKQGLSQNKLAYDIDEDPAVISKMCYGKRLYGPLARQRIVNMITWFYKQGISITVQDANELLEAAGHAQLQNDEDNERHLLNILSSNTNLQTTTLNISHSTQKAPPHKQTIKSLKKSEVPLILITGWVVKDISGHKIGVLLAIWIIIKLKDDVPW